MTTSTIDPPMPTHHPISIDYSNPGAYHQLFLDISWQSHPASTHSEAFARTEFQIGDFFQHNSGIKHLFIHHIRLKTAEYPDGVTRDIIAATSDSPILCRIDIVNHRTAILCNRHIYKENQKEIIIGQCKIKDFITSPFSSGDWINANAFRDMQTRLIISFERTPTPEFGEVHTNIYDIEIGIEFIGNLQSDQIGLIRQMHLNIGRH